MKFWQRTSFWTKVTVFFNIAMTSVQGALTSNHSGETLKWVFIGIQIFGNGIMLFTEDKNNNDRPDIFEEEITVKVKSDSPVDVEVTKEEIKPK